MDEEVKLPEDIKNLIEEELSEKQKSLERFREKNDTEMIHHREEEIELLNSDPKTYFENKLNKENGPVDMLNYVSNDPEYSSRKTKEEKEESRKRYTEQIQQLRRIIDALEASSKK